MDSVPRLLVVDASILFSFFKTDSVRRQVIKELPRRGCRLVSPDFVLEELSKGRERIKRFSELNELRFAFLLSLLEREIEPFPKEVYERFLSPANEISPHGEHTKDDPYFALALAYNSPIWSDEEAFKQQSRVEVFSTKELAKLLGLE